MKNFSLGYAKFFMSRNYKIVRLCIIVLKDILRNKGMWLNVIILFLSFIVTVTVFTHVYIKVDLLQPKIQSKKLPLTYTWVKNWDKKKFRTN